MSYNVPVQILQGGSVLNIGAGGSFVATSAAQVALPGITLGGTLAKWAFGTTALTSGVGTIGVPGFTRVLSVSANPILGEAPGLGSFTTLMVDLSLAASGSIIFHAGAGTLPYSNNGTVSWMAFGT